MTRLILLASEDPLQAAAVQSEQHRNDIRLPAELARLLAPPAAVSPPRGTPTARLTHTTSLRAHLIARAILRRRPPFSSLQTILRTRTGRRSRHILKRPAPRRSSSHSPCL